MEVFLMMIPLTLFLSGAALAFVVWGIKKGQYDDLETPALRMLIEDNRKETTRE